MSGFRCAECADTGLVARHDADAVVRGRCPGPLKANDVLGRNQPRLLCGCPPVRCSACGPLMRPMPPLR